MRGAEWLARSAELAAVERLLDDRDPGPRALLMHGEPGIGKTTVCVAAMAAARDRDFLVLATRGSQSETGLSFAGLTDLLDEATDGLLHELPEPQRIALEVALARRMPGTAPVGQREVGMAVLTMLRTLCAQRRVFVVLDDVSWVDSPTVEALRFALRRMRSEPIRLLGSVRLDQTPSQLWREITVDDLHLDPLDERTIDQLLRTRLNLSLRPRVLRTLVRRTAGNPFWALEVGRAITRQHGEPTTDLPLPTSLTTVVNERLAELDMDTQAALIATSALAYPTVSLTTRALQGIVKDPLDAIDAAVTAGMVAESSGRLRPAHPLLGYAALETLAPGGRAALHRRLATIVSDPEQRARHMAIAAEPPDAEVAGVLDDGATAARTRGATGAAAELAELAVEFTPASALVDLGRRRVAAAEVLYALGERERALQYIDEKDMAGMPPDLRRQNLPFLVEVIYWSRGPEAAQDMIRRAIAEAGDDTHLRAVAFAMASDVGDGEGGDREAYATKALELFDGLDVEPDPAALASALIHLTDTNIGAGRGMREDLLSRAEQVQATMPWMPITARASTIRGYFLKTVDDLAGSRVVLGRAIKQAMDEGEDGALSPLFGHLALTECWAGRYAEAGAAMDEAVRRASGLIPAVLYATDGLLRVLTGDLDGAQQLIEDQFNAEGPAIGFRKAIVYRQVLGAVALLRGDDTTAVSVLTTAMDMAGAEGIREPSRRQRLDSDLGQALVNTGRLDEAQSLADELIDLGTRSARPTLLGVGLRIQGLAEAARGDLSSAASTLDNAVAAHTQTQLPLEYGRTLLAQGQVLRRNKAKGEARIALENALACFTAIGATPFTEIATTELTRVQPARSGGTLTKTERKIAELVATGLTNREVAAQLFASVRTVEGHLAAVYRKLGVRSRTELARLLSDQED
ncbi:AAA family ATPase [Actinocrispum wychmicini]|nr:LuxR family transcriptional regulator [Actinocrispum wychmicini]